MAKQHIQCSAGYEQKTSLSKKGAHLPYNLYSVCPGVAYPWDLRSSSLKRLSYGLGLLGDSVSVFFSPSQAMHEKLNILIMRWHGSLSWCWRGEKMEKMEVIAW